MAPKRSRDSDISFDWDGFDPLEVQLPASKRRTLSTLDASSISSTFDPVFRSTLRSQVIEVALPPVVSVEESSSSSAHNLSDIDATELYTILFNSSTESDGAASDVEDGVSDGAVSDGEGAADGAVCNNSMLLYNETAVASDHTISTEDPYVDPIPPRPLVPADYSNPGYKLCRKSSQKGRDKILFLYSDKRGHAFTPECKPLKNGRLLWHCTCKGKRSKDCHARIDTPVNYDDPSQQNELNVILDVNVRESYHSHDAKVNIYEELVLYRDSKQTGLDQPETRTTDIVTTYNNNLVQQDVDTQGFRKRHNQIRVLNYKRMPVTGAHPKKNNLATWEPNMANVHAKDFVKASASTVNRNKKGQEIHRRFFCATNEQLALLRKVNRIRIDGTFKIIRQPFYQLVSLHAYVKYGHRRRSMPLGYIIMSGKTQADYIDIFRKIKSKVEEDGTVWNLQAAMLDFELGLRNSLKKVWPNIRLSGCWFHYTQAIWRKVQKLGLEKVYHQRFGAKFIKRIMVLPLFHANDCMMQRVFCALQSKFNEDKSNMTPEIAAAFEEFFSYVHKQWVFNPKIPNGELSVFGTDVRTNNTTENWNGKIWRDADGKSMTFYKLLKFLRKHHENDINVLAITDEPRPDKRQEAKDKQIRDIWDKMKAKTLQPLVALDELTEVCYKKDAVIEVIHNDNMMTYTCDDIDEDIE